MHNGGFICLEENNVNIPHFVRNGSWVSFEQGQCKERNSKNLLLIVFFEYSIFWALERWQETTFIIFIVF